MNLTEYQRAAKRTSLAEPHRERLMVQALGLCGEAGEVADLIKKWAWHDKELSRDAMADELGDVLWYVADLASAMNLSLDFIAEQNVAKLLKRFPDGFVTGGGIR
jgi:NTP pyrophosphatase (non-canonical NTP hydrolase)